jgi:hypothetical protein
MDGFGSIKELLTTLKREDHLLSEMFSKRKSMDYTLNDALELVDHDEGRIDHLIRTTVIRENDGILELEDNFLEFFEQVLDVSEEINLSYIDDNIKNIKENIDYFLNETSESKKYNYLRFIKKTLRKMGNTTLRSVVDLRRNVENTFKNEANYKNKRLKLENFDKKRSVVSNLIHQTLALIKDGQITFLNRALDEELRKIIIELKHQLGECSHNLIEIEKQIIDFLNQIKQQGKFVEKLRKLKYLKDHFTIEAETNIKQLLGDRNQIIFETRINEPLKLSLRYLRENETAFDSIKKVAFNQKNRTLVIREIAGGISNESIENGVVEEVAIVLEEVKSSFVATSDNLFHFVMNYEFFKPVDFNERVTIFCQIISQYENELQVTDQFQTTGCVEYALVLPK